MAQNFFIQSSTVGVDLNNGNSTALFTVGTRVMGNSQTEWVYVQAGLSINGNTVVGYNSGTFTCNMVSAADMGVSGFELAVAQTSISAQAYGWVAVKGVGLSIAINGTTTATGTFYVAGTAAGSGKGDQSTGMLSNSMTGTGTVRGFQLVSSTASGTATGSGYALAVFNFMYPRSNAVNND